MRPRITTASAATLAALAALAALTAGVLAHVPLVHPTNGNILHWSSPTNVGIVINSTGSDDVSDGSHETALRLGIDEWNAVEGTSIALLEDTSDAAQARTDWTSSSVHLILFDETNASGYFPFGSGTVAITPIWFFNDGRISDADILFNGSGFNFTTSGQSGRFDIGDVGTHELGHLIGLDHTAWAGGTMYPFVDTSVILHRSLSEDEAHGLRNVYPLGAYGRITGTIRRASDNSIVRGAHVVARDSAGRTAASILTTNSGTFTLYGLEADTYQVYVTPLGNGLGGGADAPVDASNLTSWFTIETDFEAELFPTTTTITGTETVAAGTLLVNADIALNLGTESDRYPKRVTSGMSQTIVLRGSGLNPASTLTASDPDLLIGTPMWFGSQVSFQVTVPAGEAPGHVDLTVMNSTGETSILSAGIEITPPTPGVSSVSPSSGANAGGTVVTVTGTGFNPGARVVIGDQIYVDGIGGTTVASATTITLTTTMTTAGTHDVVVIDATGVEGRAVAAFQTLALPVISTIFPAAGTVGGATDVVITGLDFIDGATVSIAGVDQGAVFVSATKLSFTTTSGSVGTQTLDVLNPGGALATSAFGYEAQADPALGTVDPSTVVAAGGETVMFTGTGFTATTNVAFGADPDTGLGGIAAASVTFVDANTLRVVTPAFSASGATSVLVQDSGTSQAHVVVGAVTVPGSGGGGGGGGGCYMVPVNGPPTAGQMLAGAWWILAILLGVGLRARRSPAIA